MNTRIETKTLKYSIEQSEILRDVSISVHNGRMVGIVGPNGSGKTTLLKHIYRALQPMKDTVYINNREMENYSYKESARELTVVKQENSSDFDFTVERMVLLGRSPYRKSFENFTKEDYEIAHRALENVGMTEYAQRSFNALSGGEKQRVLIARSLAQQADIYILDEPTNHLDVHYQWSIMSLIKHLGATVLGVFHEMNLAAHYCDEIYVLSRGEVVAHGEPSEILTSELMAMVFGVEADVISLDDGSPYIIFRGEKKEVKMA